MSLEQLQKYPTDITVFIAFLVHTSWTLNLAITVQQIDVFFNTLYVSSFDDDDAAMATWTDRGWEAASRLATRKCGGFRVTPLPSGE